MSKREWFFKRGNARLSWETLPEWMKWVAVNDDGSVYSYASKPRQRIDGAWEAFDLPDFAEIALVGYFCPDWRDLLFERPNPVTDNITLCWEDYDLAEELKKKNLSGLIPNCLLCYRQPLPTITTEEWAAIRLLLPGAEYVMKSRNYGYVNASNMKPVLYEWSGDWEVPVKGEVIRVPVLDRRFDPVPWRESLVKYEPKMLQEPRFKITCTCGENITMCDSNETSYLTYQAKCPKCGDVWEIGWNVE